MNIKQWILVLALVGTQEVYSSVPREEYIEKSPYYVSNCDPFEGAGTHARADSPTEKSQLCAPRRSIDVREDSDESFRKRSARERSADVIDAYCRGYGLPDPRVAPQKYTVYMAGPVGSGEPAASKPSISTEDEKRMELLRQEWEQFRPTTRLNAQQYTDLTLKHAKLMSILNKIAINTGLPFCFWLQHYVTRDTADTKYAVDLEKFQSTIRTPGYSDADLRRVAVAIDAIDPEELKLLLENYNLSIAHLRELKDKNPKLNFEPVKYNEQGKELYFKGQGISSIEGIDSYCDSALDPVKVIDLSDNRIKVLPKNAFINFKDLKKLNLTGNPIAQDPKNRSALRYYLGVPEGCEVVCEKPLRK